MSIKCDKNDTRSGDKRTEKSKELDRKGKLPWVSSELAVDRGSA